METKSKQFLFLAALGCMAAPVAAQTVDVSIDCGQSYPIKSTVDASAGNATITYRWLENGSTVTPEGEAYTSYTVPATKSVGLYTYIRQAKTDDCDDWQSSNAFTVEVKNKDGIDGVCLGGAMWAKYNVDAPESFTATPMALGNLYQFNRTKPWDHNLESYNLPPNTGNVDWQADSSVCPKGWRIPSASDISSFLVCASNSACATTSQYPASDTQPYASFVVSSGPVPSTDPNRSIIFYVVGYILELGIYNTEGSHLWSSTSHDEIDAYRTYFQEGYPPASVYHRNKNRACSIRCIQ
jgi:uncharacterized protein (TIGR02145 family)